MVKPLYIVFFFFALSLCGEECVTLTKKANNENGFECNPKNDTIGICGKLGLDQGEANQNVILKLTEILSHEQVKPNKSSVKFRIIPPQEDNENSEILKLCYEVAEPEIPSQVPTQAKNEPLKEQPQQSQKPQLRRILKTDVKNPSSNTLLTPTDGLNQKLKDSLIMAI